MPEHIPVLLTEVVSAFSLQKGDAFLDATMGLGGHSKKLIAHFPKAIFYGIDQDPEALEIAKERVPQAELLLGNFQDLAVIAKEHALPLFKGILMDIGVSSLQIDIAGRGFSFQQDGPLDMRMDPENTVTAATIVNTWLEFKLVNLFSHYGEERFSKTIARKIVQHRKKHPFYTTKELADFLVECYPVGLRSKHPHPATRVFQALRIEVNRELDALEMGIEASFSVLAPGGRLAVISFHSLEDRIVKHMFRQAEAAGFGVVITKKPVIASKEEQADNPRSRSAKLRIWENKKA